jgi:hypothetical protein
MKQGEPLNQLPSTARQMLDIASPIKDRFNPVPKNIRRGGCFPPQKFFSFCSLSGRSAFSQTQTDATVPF